MNCDGELSVPKKTNIRRTQSHIKSSFAGRSLLFYLSTTCSPSLITFPITYLLTTDLPHKTSSNYLRPLFSHPIIPCRRPPSGPVCHETSPVLPHSCDRVYPLMIPSISVFEPEGGFVCLCTPLACHITVGFYHLLGKEILADKTTQTS